MAYARTARRQKNQKIITEKGPLRTSGESKPLEVYNERIIIKSYDVSSRNGGSKDAALNNHQTTTSRLPLNLPFRAPYRSEPANGTVDLLLAPHRPREAARASDKIACTASRGRSVGRTGGNFFFVFEKQIPGFAPRTPEVTHFYKSLGNNKPRVMPFNIIMQDAGNIRHFPGTLSE